MQKINWPDFLKDFRKKNNMTQKRMAVALGCSKRAIEGWEAGKRKPPHFLIYAMRWLEKKHI